MRVWTRMSESVALDIKRTLPLQIPGTESVLRHMCWAYVWIERVVVRRVFPACLYIAIRPFSDVVDAPKYMWYWYQCQKNAHRYRWVLFRDERIQQVRAHLAQSASCCVLHVREGKLWRTFKWLSEQCLRFICEKRLARAQRFTLSLSVAVLNE